MEYALQILTVVYNAKIAFIRRGQLDRPTLNKAQGT